MSKKREQSSEGERGDGDFVEAAHVAQMFKDIARGSRNWAVLPSFAREALDGLFVALARVLTGDWRRDDHLDDCAISVDRIRKLQRKKP
jgi:hypothetical protein